MHGQVVDPPADKPGHEPENRTDHGGAQCRRQSDQQGYPPAVKQPQKQVPAELVCPKPVNRAGGCEAVEQVDAGRVQSEHGLEQGGGGDQQSESGQQDQAGDRRGIGAQAPPRLAGTGHRTSHPCAPLR